MTGPCEWCEREQATHKTVAGNFCDRCVLLRLTRKGNVLTNLPQR